MDCEWETDYLDIDAAIVLFFVHDFVRKICTFFLEKGIKYRQMKTSIDVAELDPLQATQAAKGHDDGLFAGTLACLAA
jgi:hypothetical protein